MFPAALCASGVRGFTRRGGGADLAPQIKAFLQLGGGWRWIWGVRERPKPGTFPPLPGPLCHPTVGTRRADRSTVRVPRSWCPPHGRVWRQPCPELLLPIATNPGENGSGNRGNSKELYPNDTETFFFSVTKLSFKRNKSCRHSVSWNLRCQRRQETVFAPFGHPPFLPSTSVDLFLGHGVA